ncbi:MAG: SDR family NAD(P)-dependent oxidoreductase [Alistipes sp.]|nr:SDR family NAD(P)-dependent oxidoreductase [Alistipes sp.]
MKRAIVIGATSGIGRAVVQQLVEQGWRVAVSGRRSEALDELRVMYGADRVITAPMDVTKESSLQVLDSMITELGAPDLFLYASGIGGQNREIDIAKELDIIDTNCKGMVRVVDHFVCYVRDCGEYNDKHKAHIAVITSIAGTRGLGSAPAYSATKSMQSTYISALAQLCSMECINVRFTDIRPGFVKTAILNPQKHYPMLMSVDSAAKHIIRGLKRKKRVLIFDWRYKLLVAFWHLIPRCVWERLRLVKN